MEVPDLGDPENGARGALCCAAAIRVGGALGVLADAVALGDDYRRVNFGIESMMRFYEGHELSMPVMGDAFAASWRIDAMFPSDRRTSRFFKAALRVVDLAIFTSRQDEGVGEISAGPEKALEAAAQWPQPVHIGSATTLVEFERACQIESLDLVRLHGISRLRAAAFSAAIEYRQLAQSFAG